MAFNINGRICIAFSFFWGVLAIFLMTFFNPKVDKIIDKIPNKYFKTVTITGIVIIAIDFIITSIALKMFFARLVKNYNLELKDASAYTIHIPYSENNRLMKFLDEKVFTDEKILKTFPNIKVIDKDDNIIYVDSILRDIQPYYFKVFTPKRP